MIIKLNDDFLDNYHIKSISCYNDNYYELPFTINYKNKDYKILHIVCDELTNEFNYSLCYLEGNIGEVIDDIYIIPSSANNYCYELNLSNINEIGWC